MINHLNRSIILSGSSFKNITLVVLGRRGYWRSKNRKSPILPQFSRNNKAYLSKKEGVNIAKTI